MGQRTIDRPLAVKGASVNEISLSSMNWWNDSTTSGTPSISVGAVSDTGVVRDENEDTYGRFSAETEDEQLFVVADGMGGHAEGREASTTTVEVLNEAFFGERGGSVPDRLRRAFHRANSRVYVMSEADEDADLMGTTATALAMVEGTAYVAHAGDSRAYRYRFGEGKQLTCDHTVVRELQRRGALTEEEARTHPRRGMLTRAVGVKPTIEVDLIEVGPLRPEDHFLLCTDGLEEIPGDVLREVVLNNAPQAACEQLVRRANERGGRDNSTALVVHVH